jgi:predicted alpha/beta superfamily hydrolase
VASPILVRIHVFGALACALWSVGAPFVQAQSRAGADAIEAFELQSEVFQNRRTIRVLLPSGYRDAANRDVRYPVFFLNDGFAIFKSSAWNAPEIVRKLEVERRIRPFILIGIDNGATAVNGSVEQRTREYLPYPDSKHEPSIADPRGAVYPDFLFREVMPAVAARYRTLSGAENTGIGGSSYGGLAALYAVIHRPGLVGRLLIESTPLFLADFAALKEARACPSWPLRISIGIGTKETDDETLAMTAGPTMQELVSAIRSNSSNAKVRLVIEPGAGHESTSWRRRLPAALEFLWPPVAEKRS